MVIAVKKVNMIKRSKDFNRALGAASCAYGKGPLLQDVLLAAGVPKNTFKDHWYCVNFASTDEPSEGAYETCI